MVIAPPAFVMVKGGWLAIKTHPKAANNHTHPANDSRDFIVANLEAVMLFGK